MNAVLTEPAAMPLPMGFALEFLLIEE